MRVELRRRDTKGLDGEGGSSRTRLRISYCEGMRIPKEVRNEALVVVVRAVQSGVEEDERKRRPFTAHEGCREGGDKWH